MGVTLGFVLDGSSEASSNYLNKEFSDIIKSCPPDKIKLIYDVAKIIKNS